MSNRIWTDRSRILEFQRCPRKRFLTYHETGTGIVPARTPLALGVGSAVHAGLAELLIHGSNEYEMFLRTPIAGHNQVIFSVGLEDRAVRAALADFSRHAAGLELDASEQSGLLDQTPEAKQLAEQMIAQARELGMAEADIAGITQGVDPAVARSEFERYLFAEQSALVEAMVRAYARRRLRPLLEEFEVLEVEREGEWKLSEWGDNGGYYFQCQICGAFNAKPNLCGSCGHDELMDMRHELWFMSRPDALLRHRQTNELFLLSYKTTGGWDVRKARDIEHDMQGLSEGVEVEKRLGEWWQVAHNEGTVLTPKLIEKWGSSLAMFRYLEALPAAPRIHAIRYEFLLKGERWKDRELSSQLGVDCKSQKSHLVYQYVATSTPKTGKNTDCFRVGDTCWSWDFVRPEDQQASKLYAGNWRPQAVWEGEGVKSWIDRLDRSEVLMSGEDSTIGMAPRVLGYRSEAQAMGVTVSHPLDAVFVPPVTVWRNDDQLRDWVEQVEHSERETAMRVAEVNAATDPGEKRSLLNRYFPQTRSACEYPGTCAYARDRVSVCWGSAEMQASPLEVGGGEYIRRQPNHPQELVTIK